MGEILQQRRAMRRMQQFEVLLPDGDTFALYDRRGGALSVPPSRVTITRDYHDNDDEL